MSRLGPRLHTGQLVSTLGALLLLVSIFLLDWYGTVGSPSGDRPGPETAATAWSDLQLLRWAMLVSVVVALGATVVNLYRGPRGPGIATGAPVALVGAVTALLVAYRVLINPPAPTSIVDLKLGAFAGLLSVLAVALGGLHTTREQRAAGLWFAPGSGVQDEVDSGHSPR